MKRTGNPNINHSWYWNSIYKGDGRKQYESQGTSSKQKNTIFNGETSRFGISIKEVKDGDKVLDIGCGVGIFTKAVKNKYPKCDVWGVDISGVVIDDNKKQGDDITYLKQSLVDLNVPTNFDFIFSGELLEHLDDPSMLLIKAYESLNTGGRLLLSTPYLDSIQSPEHVFEFSHEDVEKLYTDNGFKNVQFIHLPNMEHLAVIVAIGEK